MTVDFVEVGDLIAFQIGEIEGFSAPNRDLWGVLKVLHLGAESSLSVSVLDALFKSCPTPLQTRFLKVLLPKRFKNMCSGSRSLKPLIFTTPIDGKIDLKSAKIIGREFFLRSAEQKALQEIGPRGNANIISNIDDAAISLDHEDRAVHDAVRWSKEIEEYSARQEETRRKIEERQRTRLKGISLDILRNEILFENWDARVRIVPQKFTTFVRNISQTLLKDLASLGPKPRRPVARKLLESYTNSLNKIDGKFGYYIETEEREDLMQFLEDVCWAIKQKPLVVEIENWRNW